MESDIAMELEAMELVAMELGIMEGLEIEGGLGVVGDSVTAVPLEGRTALDATGCLEIITTVALEGEEEGEASLSAGWLPSLTQLLPTPCPQQ